MILLVSEQCGVLGFQTGTAAWYRVNDAAEGVLNFYIGTGKFLNVGGTLKRPGMSRFIM